MSSKLDLAARSFETVLRHVEHEDNKANRILFAMAFLTAAAAAVFAATTGDSDPVATIPGEKVNVAVLMFAIFAGLVLGGTLFMLAALGPKHNLLKEWFGPKPTTWEREKGSLLFSEVIARHSHAIWKKRWDSNGAAGLEEEMVENLINETYLLARKAKYKVKMMSYGRSLFKGAMMALAWFLVVSFAGRLEFSLPLGGLIVSLIVLQTAWESGTQPAGVEGDIFPSSVPKLIRRFLSDFPSSVLEFRRFVSEGEHVGERLFSFICLVIGILGLLVSVIFTLVVWQKVAIPGP